MFTAIAKNMQTGPAARRFRAAIAIFTLLPGFASYAAAPITPAQEPLYSASTATVYPNLQFLLDKSGSMSWDFVPDYVRDYDTSPGQPSCFDNGSSIADVRRNCGVGDPPFMSADFNLIYYNPDFTYTPGWNGTLGTPAAYPAQSIGNVTLDPYGRQKNTQLTNGNTGSTIDLTSNYPDRRWCLRNDIAIDRAATWINLTAAGANTRFSALSVGGTTVLSGTTTSATGPAAVAQAIVNNVTGSYTTSYVPGATGFWLIGPAGTTGALSHTIVAGSATVVYEPAPTWSAACRGNSNATLPGYKYPDQEFKHPPNSGGTQAAARDTNSNDTAFGPSADQYRYAMGAPYYWRIIPSEYCSDVALKVCVNWKLANASIGSSNKYCAGPARTFATCQATEDATHRFPAKCSASACVEPGNGSTYRFPAPTRFCVPDGTNPNTEPLLNCQGSYNSVSGHVVPKFLGHVVPAAGENSYGTITVLDATPGLQLSSITITGSATNLMTGPYTVPVGATTASVAAGIRALINSSYQLDGARAITRVAEGNVIQIAAAVVGDLDNGKVITVAGPAGSTAGTASTGTITISAGANTVADYRLGPICIGTVAGTFPTQTCSGLIISNGVTLPGTNMSDANDRDAVALAVATSINNTAIGGYTATAAGNVVTITAPQVGAFTSPIAIMTPDTAGVNATGSIVVGAISGSFPYTIDSVKVGASTVISSGAINGTWDLSTPAGRNTAANAIRAAITNGYTGAVVAGTGTVDVTSTVGGSAFNNVLSIVSPGKKASGTITVNAGTSGVRRYFINSITVTKPTLPTPTVVTLVTNLSIAADLSVPAGRQAAATAIKNAISGGGYTASCSGGAICNADVVTITAPNTGPNENATLAVNVAAAASLSPAALTLRIEGSGTASDVSGIWRTGCTDSSLNTTSGTGILVNNPAPSNVPNTVAGNIFSANMHPTSDLAGRGGLIMTRVNNEVTFTPVAGYGSRLDGCRLEVQFSTPGSLSFTWMSGDTFSGRDFLPSAKTNLSGGQYPFPAVVSGMAGGTTVTAIAVSTSAISGGTNASGAIPVATADFDFGSAAGSEKRVGVGSFVRCDITATADCAGLGAGNFPRASSRTDCSNAGFCTYAEESTNFANWYAYYRTRLQAMKTGAGLAFSNLGATYRVGFASIYTNDTGNADFLMINDFNTTQKQSWYTKFFASSPGGGTPLRSALARAGQMFAHKGNLAAGDPVQYSCQQNFVMLTTDGYWNTDTCTDVNQVNNSTDIGQQDGAPNIAQTKIPPEQWDGDLGGACLNATDGPSSVGTLADVAYYYANTDLRTSGLNNCTNGVLGAGVDVCKNNVPSANSAEPAFQHMTTYTLGLGVSGTLLYDPAYQTATTGDYADIKRKLKKWPQVTGGSQTTVDDLWHAAVNGYGRYFSARSPSELRSNLEDALASIKSTIGSGAAAATSAQALTTQTTNYAYVASYQTVQWTGNLERRSIDATTAEVSPSASWCVTDVTADLSTGATACSGTLKTQIAANSDTRNIYLFDAANNFGNGLRSFTWGNLSAGEQGYFNPCSPIAPLVALSQCSTLSPGTLAATTGSALVDYLRGRTGQEMDSATNTFQSFRARKNPLGDAVGSQPVYVGPPSNKYLDPGYAEYAATGTSVVTWPTGFPTTVFLGANDGMLHAINAETGVERWAFIPGALLKQLRLLADDNYSQANRHRYFVNAGVTVEDVCFGTCTTLANSNWHTILVGGYGGGGKGFYAIDITDPTQPLGLWEFGVAEDADMGYSYGNPVITKRPDGKWVVLLTSGYENGGAGTGHGILWSIDPQTGDVLTKISNRSGSSVAPSGLAKINSFVEKKSNNNQSRDVYGGDLDGNIWRYRLDVGAESVVKVAQLADVNSKPQPVTTVPIPTTRGNAAQTRMLIVATGRLLTTSDMTNSDPQSIYSFDEIYDVLCAADASVPASNCVNAPKGYVTDSSGSRGSASTVPGTRATLGHCGGAFAVSPGLPAFCPDGGRDQLTGSTLVADGLDAKGRDLRRTDTANLIAPTRTPVMQGCYVNLPDTGERTNVDPVLINGKLVVVTNVPENTACSTGGRSFQNVFKYDTCIAEQSVELGSALAVGLTVVTSASGEYIPLVTLANDPTPTPGNPAGQSAGSFTGRRTGWRLIND